MSFVSPLDLKNMNIVRCRILNKSSCILTIISTPSSPTMSTTVAQLDTHTKTRSSITHSRTLKMLHHGNPILRHTVRHIGGGTATCATYANTYTYAHKEPVCPAQPMTSECVGVACIHPLMPFTWFPVPSCAMRSWLPTASTQHNNPRHNSPLCNFQLPPLPPLHTNTHTNTLTRPFAIQMALPMSTIPYMHQHQHTHGYTHIHKYPSPHIPCTFIYLYRYIHICIRTTVQSSAYICAVRTTGTPIYPLVVGVWRIAKARRRTHAT